MVNNDGIQVGIIGCGVIAPTHIQSFQRLSDVTVKWACDLKQDVASSRAEKYNIARTTTDYRQVLDDSDVSLVSVCTDHASHEQIVRDAFAAGKHVLCEKALAISNEQLESMVHAHAATPQLVFSGVFQHRFDSVNRVARELVAEGALGTMLNASMSLDCYRAPSYYDDDWHGTWSREGGSVLINQAIHFVDALVWIMGGAKDISAMYANLAHGDAIETEDTLAAAITFQNGSLGTIKVTSASHLQWQHTLTFTGTEGQLVLIGDDAAKVNLKDSALQAQVEQRLKSAGESKGVEAGRDYYGTGHPAQIADVVAAIREGRKPFVTGESASHTVEVVLAAYASHRSGQRVALSQTPTSLSV